MQNRIMDRVIYFGQSNDVEKCYKTIPEGHYSALGLFHALTKVYPFVLYEIDEKEEMVYDNL